MDVTLDTVGDSISLEFLLTLLPFMSLFGTRLGSYSVYQWSYLSTVNVTLDTVEDSISLEFLLTLLPFMSLVQDLDLTQYISGLTYQQWMIPWIQ